MISYFTLRIHFVLFYCVVFLNADYKIKLVVLFIEKRRYACGSISC